MLRGKNPMPQRYGVSLRLGWPAPAIGVMTRASIPRRSSRTTRSDQFSGDGRPQIGPPGKSAKICLVVGHASGGELNDNFWKQITFGRQEALRREAVRRRAFRRRPGVASHAIVHGHACNHAIAVMQAFASPSKSVPSGKKRQQGQEQHQKPGQPKHIASHGSRITYFGRAPLSTKKREIRSGGHVASALSRASRTVRQ